MAYFLIMLEYEKGTLDNRIYRNPASRCSLSGFTENTLELKSLNMDRTMVRV